MVKGRSHDTYASPTSGSSGIDEHRFDVLGHGAFGGGSGVPGEVIGAAHDDDDFRLQGDDVLPETNEHLRCGLVFDAAVEIWLAGEEVRPLFEDVIAKENNPVFISSSPAITTNGICFLFA